MALLLRVRVVVWCGLAVRVDVLGGGCNPSEPRLPVKRSVRRLPTFPQADVLLDEVLLCGPEGVITSVGLTRARLRQKRPTRRPHNLFFIVAQMKQQREIG